MTGQAPEAPDHETLTPADLQRLHRFCAAQMERRAKGMEDHTFCATFKKGDIVLVHQVSKRSHKDLRGIGPKSYPARAVVIKQSASNESHYQIRWLTDGLHAKEKKGDVSKKMWIGWKLKLCKAGLGNHAGKKERRMRTRLLLMFSTAIRILLRLLRKTRKLSTTDPRSVTEKKFLTLPRGV